MMKHIFFLLLSGYLLIGLAACKQHSPCGDQLARIDSLADVNPDSADMLLKPTPVPSLKGRENEEVCKLLRIKTDDKLYRPVTHYRDTILQLIDYFEHHPKVLPSLLGSTGPTLPYLYAGRIFADLGDAPQALDYYQQALDVQPTTPPPFGRVSERYRIAKQRGLLHSLRGELYHQQGLYKQSLNSFLLANKWAILANDTADMIFNYRDIAIQHRSLNQDKLCIDYLNKALSLAALSNNSRLCNDVMLQLASAYNESGDANKAMHYLRPSLKRIDSVSISAIYNIASKIYKKQKYQDSAVLCYHKLLQYGNIYGRRNAYLELSEISLRNNDVISAKDYLHNYVQLYDSIRNTENAETVARMHAAYNYQKHKQKAMELELVNAHQKIAIILIILSSFLILGFLYLIFKKRQQRLSKKMFRLKVLTEDIRRRSSEYQELTVSRISELNEKIQELKRNSQAANLRHQEEMLQLVAEKDQLEFQLKKQKSCEEVKATGMKAIKQSAVYQQFVKLDNQNNDTPSFSDWAELQRCVNLYFPEFEEHLKGLCKMTNQQYRACMLRWLGFGPSSTAFLTCYSKSSVSNLYMRLYENIMGKKGTMKEFDELLKGL